MVRGSMATECHGWARTERAATAAGFVLQAGLYGTSRNPGTIVIAQIVAVHPRCPTYGHAMTRSRSILRVGLAFGLGALGVAGCDNKADPAEYNNRITDLMNAAMLL